MFWGAPAAPRVAPAPPADASPTPATRRAAETAKQFIEGLCAAQRRAVADRTGR